MSSGVPFSLNKTKAACPDSTYQSSSEVKTTNLKTTNRNPITKSQTHGSIAIVSEKRSRIYYSESHILFSLNVLKREWSAPGTQNTLGSLTE